MGDRVALLLGNRTLHIIYRAYLPIRHSLNSSPNKSLLKAGERVVFATDKN